MRNRSGVPAMRTLHQPPLLDIHAVAQALGITSRHVQRLVAERRIPFLKVGRFVRFDPRGRVREDAPEAVSLGQPIAKTPDQENQRR